MEACTAKESRIVEVMLKRYIASTRITTITVETLGVGGFIKSMTYVTHKRTAHAYALGITHATFINASVALKALLQETC